MFIPQNDFDDNSIRNDVTNKFQAYLSQQDDSNNQRLLNILSDFFIQTKNDMYKIYDLSFINTSKGDSLTKLAKDYGISRIDNDDEFLRFELRWQILKSKTPTTMNGLKALISVLLDISPSVFDIVPGGNVESIIIKNLPFNFVGTDHESIKKELLSQNIQSILPVEWQLDHIEYSLYSDTNIYYGIISNRTFSKVENVPINSEVRDK